MGVGCYFFVMLRYQPAFVVSIPMNNIKICFADLTHTGQIVAANTFPLGIAMVAAYAQAKLGAQGDAQVDMQIFKYPDDLSDYLATNTPDLVCFSNFSWNLMLSHAYASRIKAQVPSVITVFGGPNYPTDKPGQEAFLRQYPAIDYYIEGEGELAFMGLYDALAEVNFDSVALKRRGAKIPNVQYIEQDRFYAGELLPRVHNVNDLPSPYRAGLMDKFFDDILIPMTQTMRGCPYACTFCHEGQRYFNKTKRWSMQRICYELDYIAERVQVPDFIIVDSNFGISKEDLDTAAKLAQLQKDRGWPQYILVATAKNNKNRVIEASKMLNGALPPGASVQTTDPEVLKAIKRKNLSLEAIIGIAQTTQKDQANSFSELILCLPGDSKKAHMRSVLDIIDAGIHYLRIYQFMMLLGTEAAGQRSREERGMQTRFRVLPRCFGAYGLYGETFPVAEIEEICVANNSMPYQDYQDCRDFGLSVEIFNNGGLFYELLQVLRWYGVKTSEFIASAHACAAGDAVIHRTIFLQYRQEERKNLWGNYADLQAFTLKPGVIQRYIAGEYGTNEIYKYRALAVFKYLDAFQRIAFQVGSDLLQAKGVMSDDLRQYLSDLQRFSACRKRDLLNTSLSMQEDYRFDFSRLMQDNFTSDPLAHKLKGHRRFRVYHQDAQINLIKGYVSQYGTTLVGLGRILLRAHISRLYRQCEAV